jgi:hypothetical protein
VLWCASHPQADSGLYYSPAGSGGGGKGAGMRDGMIRCGLGWAPIKAFGHDFAPFQD